MELYPGIRAGIRDRAMPPTDDAAVTAKGEAGTILVIGRCQYRHELRSAAVSGLAYDTKRI